MSDNSETIAEILAPNILYFGISNKFNKILIAVEIPKKTAKRCCFPALIKTAKKEVLMNIMRKAIDNQRKAKLASENSGSNSKSINRGARIKRPDAKGIAITIIKINVF